MSESHAIYLKFVNDVFDKVKEELNLTSDAALAEWLGDNQGNVSKYRVGKRVLNDWKLVRACKAVDIQLPTVLNMILRYKSLSADAQAALTDILEMLSKK